MKLKLFLTAGGNPSLLVWGCPKGLEKQVINKYLGKKGNLFVSGVKGKVNYSNSPIKTTIYLPLKFDQKENVILFEGIGFICRKDKKPNKEELLFLIKKYKLPAFGVVLFEGNQSKPYVYVKGTDSLTAETACGSGSIALNIVTGIKDIMQPSGGIISITRQGNQFKIEATVKEINLKGDE